MSRRITPSTSVDNLKHEAKRWLKALRAGDARATARFARTTSSQRDAPTLRAIQHALALEFGFASWSALVHAVGTARDAEASGNPQLQLLLDAAARGDAAAVAGALDADPSLVSVRGILRGHSGLRSALHFAVGGPHRDVVALLLARGADANVRDAGDNALPLHFAVEKGDAEIVQMLVEHGSDTIGAGDVHALDVIGWATVFGKGDRDIVAYLLAHGARHNIWSAVATGAVVAIRDIVASDRNALERTMDRANRHRYPLHLAVVKKHERALSLLLELGADITTHDSAGFTALDQAAFDGEQALVDMLLAHGAAVELPAALALNRIDIVEQLLRNQPDVLRPGQHFGALIIRAAERSSAALMETLIAAGADVNVEDSESESVDGTSGYTALHAAAFHGNADAARVLLAHGANVAARDSTYGGSPVGWASFAGKKELVALLAAGAIDIIDAVDFNRPERIRELVLADPGVLERPLSSYYRATPQVNDWMKPEWTPLQLAEELDNAAIVALLRELGAGIDIAAVNRFLDHACPDHHVRGRSDHLRAQGVAMRMLARDPGLATATFQTAIVTGNVEAVRRALAADPTLAVRPTAPNAQRTGVGNFGDLERDLGSKGWEPILYLCFARLPLPAVAEHAVTIATLLLDHGANPNAFFMAGDSHYTPLVGVVGEGEEDRPAHPARDALVQLLMSRGAEPYDQQVGYNIGFHGDVLWWLQAVYARSVELGREADWQDPSWQMLNMGNYGSGARRYLGVAIEHHNVQLAEWCLEHGASANAEPPRARNMPQQSLYELAVRSGASDIAELLRAHGAVDVDLVLRPTDRLLAAALHGDVDTARELVRQDPSLRNDAHAIGIAVQRDRADAVRVLLDAGVSAEVENSDGERPLHVAAWSHALSAAALLIERGAEVDSVRGNYQNTALGAAGYFRDSEMITLLSEHSRDFWELVYLGQLPRLRQLLRESPQLGRVRSNDQTPLMWLPIDDEERAIAVAQLLLDHGADADVVNEKGVTAADRAERLGMVKLAELLRNHRGESTRPTLATFEAMAERLLDAYRTGSPDAMQRHWNDTWHQREWGAMRRYVLADLGIRQQSETDFPPITIDDARQWTAWSRHFDNWAALTDWVTHLPAGRRMITMTPVTVSRDARNHSADAVRVRDWETAIAVIREREYSAVNAEGQMSDEALSLIAHVSHVTSLHLGGSKALTDDGILLLSRMPQLRHLDLSGTALTDRGLAVLRDLPALESVSLSDTRVSDAGLTELAHCDRIETVDLTWTATGDGALRALAGKGHLRSLRSGTGVTDAGIVLLHQIPVFKTWHGGEVAISLLSYDAAPNQLMLRGSFTDRGIEAMRGLDGLFGLNIDDRNLAITAAAMIPLSSLPNLGWLAVDAHDEWLPAIARMPALRFLGMQDTTAGDDGFTALSESKTIECIWGRRCHNLRTRGFTALAHMPALRGLSVSCLNVDDAAIALLPSFPALRELMPMDIPDAGYRHIGRCSALESLILMYCRDTTDAATEQITELSKLSYYFNSYTTITDRTPELLSTINSLERIVFDVCHGLTDAGIRQLARLPALRELRASGKQITAAAAEGFGADVMVRVGD